MMSSRSVLSLLGFAPLLLAACDPRSFWGDSFIEDDTRNCVRFPGMCGTGGGCNPLTRVCQRSDSTGPLHGVWGSGPERVFAVGAGGLILRFDGVYVREATVMSRGATKGTLFGVGGAALPAGGVEVWAVGEGGLVLRSTDGLTFSEVPQALTRVALRAVWAAGPGDVWIVGDKGTVLHFEGDKILAVPVDIGLNLYSVHGSDAENVYAVGAQGIAWRLAQTGAWQRVRSETQFDLFGVHVIGPGEAVAVGDHAVIARLNDGVFMVEHQGEVPLYSVWGSAADDIYAVGAGGALKRFDGSAWELVITTDEGDALRSIWHEWVVGQRSVEPSGLLYKYQRAERVLTPFPIMLGGR